MQATMISITFRLWPFLVIAAKKQIDLEPPPRRPLPDLRARYEPEPAMPPPAPPRPRVTRQSRSNVTKRYCEHCQAVHPEDPDQWVELTSARQLSCGPAGRQWRKRHK